MRRRRPPSRRERPRVLVLVENLPLARDGRLAKQVRTLLAAGYDVTVVGRGDPGNRAFAGVDLVEYSPPRDAASRVGFIREYGYSWLMAAWAFVRVAVRPGFDALQVCGAPDIYFPFGLLARALGKPVIYDQRDPSPELYAARYGSDRGPVHRVLRLLEAATYRTAAHVITVNRSLERVARSRGRVPADRVSVVMNGPVLDTVSTAAPRPELRNGRAHLCCWVGWMGPQDHLELAVRAVHHLVHRAGRTDSSFALIGDGESRAEAMRLASELGVEDWVSFPGFLSQEDVYDYLSTADIGIDPGLDDTVSPVKAMEYMALGLPFVAFDLREVRALAGDTAWYAPPGDVERFAGLIGDLLDDPVARRELGRAGRRRVEECLAWDHQAALYVDVFDRLLRQRRLPAAEGGGSGTAA
jgi:glycosyltransferase involved in cell wall biosynthesis